MDPLSVIASVAGIATAAGEVIKILGPYTTAREDAPKIAAEVSSETLATQTIITGLEQLISNFSTSNVRYASLIQVDQLTAVLFDGVKIFPSCWQRCRRCRHLNLVALVEACGRRSSGSERRVL